MDTIPVALQEIAKLVTVSGATSFLTWLALRFTKPVDSYTEEFAEQLAKHQNLDRIIEHTERVTAAAESIRNQLSHDTWDRQQRWLKKYDLYTNIIQKLDDYTNAAHLSWAEASVLPEGNQGADSKPVDSSRRDAALESLTSCYLDIMRLRSAADLAGGQRPLDILWQLTPMANFLIQHGTMLGSLEATAKESIRLLTHFVEAARADLGYEPVPARRSFN